MLLVRLAPASFKVPRVAVSWTVHPHTGSGGPRHGLPHCLGTQGTGCEPLGTTADHRDSLCEGRARPGPGSTSSDVKTRFEENLQR